jgi:PAS domain S-box-containing protein
MRLIYQILLLVYLPLAIMAGMYLYQTGSLLDRLDQSIHAEFRQTRTGVEERFRLETAYLSSVARLLATGPEVVDALHSGDNDLLFDRARSFVGDVVDYVAFVDTEGIVIVRGHDEFVFGDSLITSTEIKGALHGEKSVGLVELDGACYLMAVTPVVRFDEKIVGAALVGMSETNALSGLKGAYHTLHLVLERGGRRLAATVPPEDIPGWDSVTFELPPEFGSDFSVTIFADNTAKRLQLRALRQQMLGMTAGLAILLGVAATLIVRRVLRPMKNLVSAMRTYPNSVLDLEGEKNGPQSLEVAELVQAFRSMTTELREKQASLVEAEKKYRGMFENSPAGMYRSTLEGRFLAANHAMARLFGFASAQELIDEVQDIATQLYAAPAQRRALHDQLASRTEPYSLEVEARRKDGRPAWLFETSWFARDEAGTVLYQEGSLIDVSERRRAEALEREKVAAEATSEAKSQFLAAMSHEIRTPMNAIAGMAQLLTETELSQEQQQYMHIFQTASNALLTLLSDILDITRMEAGQLELDNEPFSPREVMDIVARIMSPRAHEKGLYLGWEVSPEVPEHVAGDPARLRQVLCNIIDNAVKFTPSGEIAFHCALEPLADEAVVLRFSVRDTGIGIPESSRESVFERFTQADSSITRQYEGSGLGLAVCKSLVELMGGKLEVDSTPEQGSTFSFTARFQPVAAPQTKPVTKQDTSPSFKPLRVLLVEDSEYNAFVVLAYLKQSRSEIDIARNGREGYEKFIQGEYDLVLMDLRMPVMDGYTATERIRQWEIEQGRSPTPIIAMTAQAFKDDKERSLAAGCTLYLTKPVRKEELLAAMASLSLLHGEETPPNGDSDTNSEADSDTNNAEGTVVVRVDPDFKEIAPRYLEMVNKNLAEMRDALDRGDFPALANMGHQMKGEGRAFGFAPISEHGGVIQQAAQEQNAAIVRQTITQLDDYLKRLVLR